MKKRASLKYLTLAEAKESARRIGFKNQIDYQARYTLDPKLPCSPGQSYKGLGWTDWYDFLGTIKPHLYPSYEEARFAARKLGVTSAKDYKDRHLEDPLLPASPYTKYRYSGWIDWHDYLGHGTVEIYNKFEDAKAAVQKLGIKSMPDYRARRGDDPKLPFSPEIFFKRKGWNGWHDFLGKRKCTPYSEYSEAREAARKFGCKHQHEYNKRYKENPRLTSNPSAYYADSGWIDWYDFLGNERPEDGSRGYPNILAIAELWIKNLTGISEKRSAVKRILNGYFKPLGLPDDHLFLLRRSNTFQAEFYKNLVEDMAPSSRRRYHTAIADFFQWVLDQYCTDEDDNERIVLPEYRNPFETSLVGFSGSIGRGYRPSQSTKIPLGYEYILRARNWLVPNSDSSHLLQPKLKELPHLQNLFDTRNDWIHVDSSLIDRNDPNCVWRVARKHFKDETGRRTWVASYQIWCPVSFVANYTLIRFPLRGQQILWLDSGEGDKEIALLEPGGSINWVPNPQQVIGLEKKRRPQAAVQRGHRDAPKIYITTNKTGVTEGGYEVEWVPDDLVYWLLLLRDWQIKYNPISHATHWTKIALPAETNQSILKARGAQCFLFREFGSGQPLQTHAVFKNILPELLYTIQRPGEDLAGLDPTCKHKKFTSPYTPHSLRVSIITAFIADGDAQVHLISKLVGHATLVMTIYYTVLNNEQMRRPLAEIEKKAAYAATERCSEALRAGGLDAVKSHLIATDGNRSLLESSPPKSACVVFDWGICCLSAAGCHDGGEIIVQRQEEAFYKPVEAGYLGQKNCTRCRHLITGVPFLGGLVALANEISLEVHVESIRYQKFTEQLKELEDEQYDALQSSTPFTRETERKAAISNQQQSAGKLDALLSDYVALNHRIQSCIEIINDPDTTANDDIRLVTASTADQICLAHEDAHTSYHLLAEICQNATIYRSANPSRAIPLIAQAIDVMAENNGLAPAMFRLTDEQKLIVANELNKLLLARIGSWERIDDLFSGKLMLLDLDAGTSKPEQISTQVRALLSTASIGTRIPQEVDKNE